MAEYPQPTGVPGVVAVPEIYACRGCLYRRGGCSKIHPSLHGCSTRKVIYIQDTEEAKTRYAITKLEASNG